MIQVICITTGLYEEYFKGFIESFENFFPGEKKLITLLTDNLSLKQKFSYNKNIIGIQTIFFPHLLYPTINLNKPVLFNAYIDKNAEYSFIVDVDTIFMKKEKEFWHLLCEVINDRNILLTKHPFYSMTKDSALWGMTKDELIHNLYTKNLTEKDERFSSYIPDVEYDYVNSSFWGGKVDAVTIFNDSIITLAKQDLVRYPYGWHIPNFMDENYVNKIHWLQQRGEYDLVKLHVDAYSILGGVESNTADSVFMYQKNLLNGEKAY